MTESRLGRIEGLVTRLVWMVATNVALMLGVLWLCGNILSRLPR